MAKVSRSKPLHLHVFAVVGMGFIAYLSEEVNEVFRFILVDVLRVQLGL